MKILLAGLMGGSNGIEVYTRQLARSLARSGHDVVVADRSPANLRRDLDEPGVATVRAPPKGWKLRRVVGPFESARAHPMLRDLAAEVGAEVIHATYPELAPACGVPLVVTAWHPVVGPIERARSSRQREQGSAWSELLFAAADRRAFRRASALVAINHTVARAMEGRGRPVRVVEPFLDDDLVVPGPRSRSPDCVFVARYLDDPRKGLALAIETVAELRRVQPETRLIVVGERAAGGAPLPAFCDERGLLPRDEVARVIAVAGCCIVPSMWEEFGYAALEALAAGVPVVCTPLPGLMELDTNGVFVAERNAADLGRAARAALDLREEVRFPSECLASSAMARLTSQYEELARAPEPELVR